MYCFFTQYRSPSLICSLDTAYLDMVDTKITPFTLIIVVHYAFDINTLILVDVTFLDPLQVEPIVSYAET